MILRGDARLLLPTLDTDSVDTVITSPPYFRQRVYGDDPAELGTEATLDTYVTELADLLDELPRLLRPGALMWLNLGDKANGSGGSGGDWQRNAGRIKGRAAKVGPLHDPAYSTGSFLDVPGAVLRELLRRGWRLRLPIVWEQGLEAADLRHIRRPRWSHEMIYLLGPPRLARKEIRRDRFYPSGLVETGSVWHFAAGGNGPSHLAPFPDELARRCTLATTLPGDTVLDPFAGSGTVPRVAEQMGRTGIGIELYDPLVNSATTVVDSFP